MSKIDLWEFKHQPRTINEMVLHESIRPKLEKALDEVPNIILSGSAGVGKGTFMDILLKSTKCEYMRINGSDETGVDAIRDKVRPFATSVGFSDHINIMYINECLSENEKIRIGTIDDWSPIKIGDLQKGHEYSCVSYNMNTDTIENDECIVVSDKIDDLYEVEMDDGRKINMTKKHPFLIKDKDGNVIEKMLQHLSEGSEVIAF